MSQYKNRQHELSACTGLMNYPVLMAADILLYNTDVVPVGDDQKQHIEFCQIIAKKFNTIFGKTFNMPRMLVSKVGSRIMGLDNPHNKMSKSYANNKTCKNA